MNLGFDARMYGLEHAGIGRYVMNLVDRLVTHKDIALTLFTTPKYAPTFSQLPNVTVVSTSIRHYSFREQTDFLSLLNHYQFDLLHVPHFNVPFFYNRPFVVTIHDILWHQVRGPSVTTLSPLKYYLKYQGYKLTVKHAVRQSQAILVPSHYVKQDLVTTFSRFSSSKIHVTYEGVSAPTSKPSTYSPLPYVVYVGSAYPHKNLIVVLKALQSLDLTLKIVGSRSVFLDQIKQQAKTLNVVDKIEFLGSLPDEAVNKLLSSAIALIHPSKSEGFGLTGLEAMAAGCPVIAAHTTALPEIYGDAALFFDSDNVGQLVSHIHQLQHDQIIRQQLIKAGLAQVKQYSWDKMVDQTLNIYHQLI